MLAFQAKYGVRPQQWRGSSEDILRRAMGKEAGRVQPATSAKIEAFLAEKYHKGQTKWVEATAGPWIYLNEKVIKAAGVKGN